MEQNLTIKDLYKKLGTFKGECFKIEDKCHEDKKKVWKEEREIWELIRENARDIVVDPLAGSPEKGWLDDYNRKLSGLRASVEKNEGIRKVIGKIPMEDVAFLRLSGEGVLDIDGNGKKTDWYYEPRNLVHPYCNCWVMNMSYLHGGPGSPAKVLFREGDNGHYYVCGVLLNEPSKTRKGHAKESQKNPVEVCAEV
jgi:hypothetical protein